MKTLGMTHAVCLTCREMIPAKVIEEAGDVFLETFCPQHGGGRRFVRADVEDYLRTLRYVKPAWVPRAFFADGERACPTDCGFCPRHEQHLCMPIVEITSRCDLACPACLVDAGGAWDMVPEELAAMLDRLIAAERQIDLLNFSGGEPLVHPRLLDLVDEALRRPEVVRVSLSTNGLALLERPELLQSLRQRNAVIALQFDGFRDKAYEVLRGRPLLKEKLAILERLEAAGLSTSLTMTVAGGLNDDQLPAVLDYFFAQRHVVSLMLQPLAFVGRGAQLAGRVPRRTIPDIVGLLAAAGRPEIRADDFQPLPCSHPLCFSLAFYLMLDGGGIVSLGRLVEASRWLDSLANRTVFGLDADEHERMKDMIYDLWSGPVGAAPDSEAVMRTLRKVLDEMTARRFDPRQAFLSTERHVKSIFLHAFQDVETFDLARVRRCCNGYPQPDGSLIPACVHNVLRRRGAGGEPG